MTDAPNSPDELAMAVELLERLRAQGAQLSSLPCGHAMIEAADEIERLRATIAVQEETIRAVDDHLFQIKDAADSFRDCDGDEVAGQVIIRVDAARARLSARQQGGAG